MSVGIPVPDVPINFVPAKAGEIITIGTLKMRIMEDGSNTGLLDSFVSAQRLGTVESIIPPHTPGPTAHWHEMHDETFLITKGTVRFHIPPHPKNPTEKIIDAHEGDYVTVPIRAPHTFSNPTDAESRFVCTMTPCFYVNYFKLLSQIAEEGKPMTKEANIKAMAVYATLPVEQGGPLA
ncbi:MAG: hypothetical protein M1820_006170 [Bogoriella megaspora]|nr:MAG: hypothetical protein M1820_006170 [Bogoriella megaspora]